MERPCRIALVGMMGSGKTTVGRLLAAATGWPYLDNDDLVRRLYDATPREILARDGEQRLREAESTALAVGLESPEPAIIGAAGGTIIDDGNRRLLRDAATVVWLQAPAEVLEARSDGAEHRPWIDTGGGAWIRSAVVERDPLYASVADLTIDTAAASAPATVERIRDELAALGVCGASQPRR
jgi:shikimate kinase